MQILNSQAQLFTFPFCKPSKTLPKPCQTLSLIFPRPLVVGKQPLSGHFTTVKSLSSDEVPVDETFLETFGPKEKETEDEARRRNWVDRGWAPWEEILTPEGEFARKSLNEGEEVPLQSPEAIEAFKMLRPKYRKKKMEESGLTEDEYYAKQFEIKGQIPEPLKTVWDGPLVVRQVPPRDWPPKGWEVDRKELEFIREAHKLQAVRVDLDELGSPRTNTDDLCLERYKVFLKQYKEWVAENNDRLEEESYKVQPAVLTLILIYFLNAYNSFISSSFNMFTMCIENCGFGFMCWDTTRIWSLVRNIYFRPVTDCLYLMQLEWAPINY